MSSNPNPLGYTFEYITACESIEEHSDLDFFYEPINPKGNFEIGETVIFLGKFINISTPHRIKGIITHTNDQGHSWGWEETWNWDIPNGTWDYAFFHTRLENPESGEVKLELFIETEEIGNGFEKISEMTVAVGW